MINIIEVAIPNNFIEERSYIVEVLFGQFLGLDYKITKAEIRDYRISFDNKTLVIRDDFFSRVSEGDQSYIRSKFVPEQVCYLSNPFTLSEDIPCIYGDEKLQISQDVITCGLDLFASSFFMLTRWEEIVIPIRDSHNRFPATASLAYRNSFLSRPIVNEYVEMLWNMLVYLNVRQERKVRKFELILTHDVDHIRKWSNWNQVLLTLAADVIKRKDLKQAISRIGHYRKITRNIEKDPFDVFEWLMDLSDSVNLKSRFYFMSGGTSHLDNNYSIDAPLVDLLIKSIVERGHIVGFHPSYNSYSDNLLWSKEKEILEHKAGVPIVEGRQHYLRFEAPVTWKIWDDNYMQIDSTCGYADKEGFRCGTGDEFSVFNVLEKKALEVKERPLIFMESRDFKCGGNVENDLFQHDLLLLVDQAKKARSKMTILFHNSSFVQEEYIKQYLEVLQCAE